MNYPCNVLTDFASYTLKFESCLQHNQAQSPQCRYFCKWHSGRVLGYHLIILMVGGWYDFIRKITVVKYGNYILYVDIVYVRLPFSFPLPLFPLVLSGEDWLGNLAVSPWCRSVASLGEGEAVRAVWRHTGIMIMKERAHTYTVTPEEKRGYLWRESLVKEHTCPLNYFLSHILFYFYMDIAGKTEEGLLHYRIILSANTNTGFFIVCLNVARCHE